jgi:hypothetical protein
MNRLIPLGFLAACLSASPVVAQVQIRQYQPQGMPMPYPSASGESHLSVVQPPLIPQATPEPVTTPPAPVYPTKPMYAITRYNQTHR